jgi:hypothetical protein
MSAYAAFDVTIDNNDGTTTTVPLETISVYDITNDEALADLETDANGHIDTGTLAVAAGTEIRFSYRQANGICGYAEIVTT